MPKLQRRLERLQELSKISTDDLAPEDEQAIIEYVEKHWQKAVDAGLENHSAILHSCKRMEEPEPKTWFFIKALLLYRPLTVSFLFALFWAHIMITSTKQEPQLPLATYIPKTLKNLERQCLNGNRKACRDFYFKIGYFQGIAKVDVKRPCLPSNHPDCQRFTKLQKQCESSGEESANCIKLGFISNKSMVTIEGSVKPIKYLNKLCDDKDHESCFDLSIHYKRVKKLKLAANFALKTCKAGEPVGCYYLIEDLGKPRKGIEFLTNLCLEKTNAKSCSLLGSLYALSNKIPKQGNKALFFNKRACALKNGSGCFGAGSIYFAGDLVKRNLHAGFHLLEQSCNNNYPAGCLLVGTFHYFGWDIIKIKRDSKKGMAIIKKSCNLKSKNACNFYKFALKNSKILREIKLNDFLNSSRSPECANMDQNECRIPKRKNLYTRLNIKIFQNLLECRRRQREKIRFRCAVKLAMLRLPKKNIP